MRHGHRMAIDRVFVAVPGGISGAFNQVRDDLVAVQIEVDPVVAAPPFLAAQHFTLEAASRRQVVYGERTVKWDELAHDCAPGVDTAS